MGNEQSTHKQNGLQTKVEEVTLQHQNGGLNGHAVKILENNVVSEVAVQKSCETPTSTLSLEIALDQTDDTSFPLAEENACLPENVEQKKETEIPSPDLPKKDPKETVEKVTFFDKLFKKKTQTPSIVENSQETNNPNENPSSPVADDPQSELAEPKEDSVTFKEPNCVSVTPTPEEGTTPEAGEDRDHLVETQEGESTEENTVMNFFKTLVNPTKTPKKEKASPDVAIDPETPPAPTTAAAQVVDAPASTAPKGMSIPPPPPPAPPILESKGETAAKPVKSITKEEAKDAAKEPEAAKAKSSKDSPFSILFRPKASKAKGATSSGAKAPVKPSAVTAEVVPQTIEVQKVDPSKASTLEASPKPEPPPVPEETKTPAKASTFKSFFKPSKVLLDQMASKVQTASASGVRLLMKTTGGAAEPKKEPSAPPAEPEAAQAVKTKEEPKATPKAPSPEAPVDNQSATSQSGEDPANIPRKMEKRNSIHLFFKNLGKRHSDAGVQTEPLAVSSAPEKAK
ncbi:breast carcinoma-amplified sequence 1 isoform X2 [Hypomesus transpacificus]|uniref:breast carcinoma-amplified sequence 1 isoform X2 n=1 Tax=Hypomesus transpacificus TaxID=137520 RepID=UPI001F07BA06|nr:breast carcinoma-amplified sequence 1 isoform X2 [Hypomesus transpacificus]